MEVGIQRFVPGRTALELACQSTEEKSR